MSSKAKAELNKELFNLIKDVRIENFLNFIDLIDLGGLVERNPDMVLGELLNDVRIVDVLELMKDYNVDAEAS